jgi:DNA anti-recombination protein RmuC
MIRELITRPGVAIDRVLDLPTRIEADIRDALKTLREIREQTQQIGDVPLALLKEMTAVKDAMNETNRQLADMNENMTRVLRLSAPIERAQERGERIRARLGLGAQAEATDPDATAVQPPTRRRTVRRGGGAGPTT